LTRTFISLFGSAVAWPAAVSAQQYVTPVVGYLDSGSAEARRDLLAAFLQGLKEAGYTEGENVELEYRRAGGKYDQLPALAGELVQLQVGAIAALGGGFVGLAAKRATSTIPIVFTGTCDPVNLGLVASLSRPGGNVTGEPR
jgi:putative ABC transport system substrate-binding protein